MIFFNIIRNMKINIRKDSGITLVALVVTIVVLLILSGISIKAVTGKNGVVKSAQTATDDAEKACMEERIDQAILSAETKNKNTTLDDVINELINRNIIKSKSDVNTTTGTITTSDPIYEIEGKLDDYIN